jgi:sulfur transfer protein SufE
MAEIKYKIVKNVLVNGEVSPMWVYKLDENDTILEFDTEEEAVTYAGTMSIPTKIVKWVNGVPPSLN